MKRKNRLENKGWNIIVYASGNGCQAINHIGSTKVIGSSITDLHKKIFGY
jgi:hypothetical protein